LRSLPFLALLGAAVDTVLVRAEFVHRPPELRLFLQAWGLWLVFGLLASIPAGLLARRRRRRHPAAAPEPTLCAALDLAVWLYLPVLIHARLDAYTSIGGNVAALAAPGPWIELAALLAAAFVVLHFGKPLLRRRPAGRVAAAVTALSLAAVTWPYFAGGREIPARSSTATGPNVLLLVWDTARAKSLAHLGYDRETTPNLDRLTEDALVFTQARSVSSYTLTSHLSMLTGVYPSNHGARMVRQRIDPLRTRPVAEDFARAGWRTGAFVGTGVLRAQTGIDWAFEVFDDQVDPPLCDTHAWALVHDLQSLAASLVPALNFNGNPHWIQDFQRPAPEVLDHAAAWIENGDPRPWFCLINLYDVHWPYLPSAAARARWVDAYGGPIDGYSKRSSSFQKGYQLDAADKHHLAELYDGEMYQLDAAVDAFLERIDLAHADTALVLTSDHGEAFGEAGSYEHDDILESQVRVPLLVRPPGGTAPRRIDTPVNGIDVAPTLLALAGLGPQAPADDDPGHPQRFTGRNLLTLDPDEQRDLLVEDRDHLDPTDVRMALYAGPWKLERRGLGDEMRWSLIDLRPPANERVDHAREHPEVLADLQARFDALRDSWGADDRADLATGGDANLETLKGLGYADGE